MLSCGRCGRIRCELWRLGFLAAGWGDCRFGSAERVCRRGRCGRGGWGRGGRVGCGWGGGGEFCGVVGFVVVVDGFGDVEEWIVVVVVDVAWECCRGLVGK